jgi:hypothetical protein
MLFILKYHTTAHDTHMRRYLAASPLDAINELLQEYNDALAERPVHIISMEVFEDKEVPLIWAPYKKLEDLNDG